MEYLPVGRRTRAQITQSQRKFIKEQKRARKAAKRKALNIGGNSFGGELEFCKKKGEKSGYGDDGSSEEGNGIEVIDKSEYEKVVFGSPSTGGETARFEDVDVDVDVVDVDGVGHGHGHGDGHDGHVHGHGHGHDGDDHGHGRDNHDDEGDDGRVGQMSIVGFDQSEGDEAMVGQKSIMGFDHESDDGNVGQKSIVGFEEKDMGVMDDGVNGGESDESVQIIEEMWNPYNDDDEDTDDDVAAVGGDSLRNSAMQVVDSAPDGAKKGNVGRDENSEEKDGIFSDSSGEDESGFSDRDYRVDETESSPDSTELSSSDASDEESEKVETGVTYDGHHPFSVKEVDGVIKEKNEKGKRRQVTSDPEFERRVFDGLKISAHPKNDGDEHQSRKRTRAHLNSRPSLKKTKDGTFRRPVVLDMEETCISEGEDESESDDEEEQNGQGHVRNHESKPHNFVHNGGYRKRGRPKKKKNTELEAPIKRKRVRGLKNSELQKILLNTMCENGEAGLEDLMSSMSNLYLPLKFTFGVEKQCPPEKSEEEQELDNLWKELDFGLEACNIGNDSSYWNNKEDVFPSVGTASREQMCAQGKHHLILEEEIGIRCKFCSFVDIEIKDVTPDFNDNPFGKSEYRRYGRFPYEDDPAFNSFQFPDASYESKAGDGTYDDTHGTVWDLIPGIKRTLYPHQQEGFEFIWRNVSGATKIEELNKPTKFGFGGCIICHAPGTGKTRLAIVFLQSYMKQYPNSKPVIIAPKSMLLTWEEEFARWKSEIPFFNLNAPDLSGNEDHKMLSTLKHGHSLDPVTIRYAKVYTWNLGRGVLGLSYTLFEKLAGERKNTGEKEKLRQTLLKQPGLLVLDEGHTPRNDNSLIWKVLSNVETKRRIILSGTPFQNNFHELYNTISLVREEFVDPLLAGCVGDLRQRRKGSSSKNMSFNMSNCNGVDEQRRIKELREKIKPFVHVHKGEILKKTLRGLFKSLVVLKPSPLQQLCLEKLARLNGGFEMDHLMSITSVHPCLLYRCENVPEFVDDEFANELKKYQLDFDAGVKTRFLLELIKLSKGEKVLVFSQYLDPLNLLGKLLKKYFNWTEERELIYMHGRQDSNKRQAFIRQFNDPHSETRVLLASTKACCEGIHLVGASRVVLLDVVWNPSVERQAISRAYRLGQQKDVFVYHLLAGAQETEKYQRQAKKDRYSELVFSSSERESVETISMPSRVSEDQILEEMIHNDRIKSIFKKIIYQPKADDLIETFGPQML